MAKIANATEATPSATAKRSRNTVAKKFYLVPGLADDRQPQKATAESVAVKFAFANGEIRTVAPSDFNENIRHLLCLYGIAQKLGDTYANSDGDIDGAVEDFDVMLERFVAGEWSVESRASGPRIGDIVRAWDMMQADAGKTVSDESRERVKALLTTGGLWTDGKTEVSPAQARAKFTGNPKIASNIEKLRAARAAERLAKLTQKAASTDDELDM